MIRALRDYLELTKPRVTVMLTVTAYMGYALAGRGYPRQALLFHTLLGTWLAAGGASALNQYMERDLDAKMRRTQNRPLPRKRLQPGQALVFGVALAVGGVLELTLFVNPLAAALTVFTLASYLFAYTPLKTRTSFCTLVGAVPGAIPPLIGWAGARGGLAPEAWVIFTIVFLWQLPHFLAIAWLYREDYARAGFAVLPVVDPSGNLAARMIILYCSVLIPVTLLPGRFGWVGYSYFWGALALGLAFLACGTYTALEHSPLRARRLVMASVIYLPLLFTWMVVA